VTPAKHRADDRLLLDGQPRSASRRRRDLSKEKPVGQAPVVQLIEDDRELRDKALKAGKVIVTDVAGNVSMTDPPRSTHQRRKRRKPRRVDPFVTTRKADRPITPQQRSEFAALCRDRQLNFDPRFAATLSRGQADQLIAKLRARANKRHRAQMNEIRTGKKPKPKGS
jgi:hypothetical protein